MKTVALLLSIVLVLLLSLASPARILNIPGDFQTVQAGINAAEEWDTVLVQPGVYAGPFNIEEPDVPVITLASLFVLNGDPAYIDSTILDGGGEVGVMRVRQHISVKGLTISNGVRGSGGGIYVQYGCMPIFEDCIVRDNRSTSSDGGGVFVNRATPTFRRVRFTHNIAAEDGGGIHFNSASGYIEDCVIDSNHAQLGGGVRGYLSSPTITRTRIFGNEAEIYAAAIIFNDNLNDWPVVLDRVTITGNRVLDRDGHGGVSWYHTDGSITNSIIRGNTAPDLTDWAQNGGWNSRLVISYSDVGGGFDQVVQNWEGEITVGDGMMDEDPLFVDPDNLNFHLAANSPCIDAGHPDSLNDPDGTRADIGALYFNQNPPEVAQQINDLVVAEDCGQIEIADLDTVFSDPNGDALSYRVLGLEQLGLSVNDENVLSIEPALNFNGDSLTVIVSASDASDSASVSFLVIVTPVNDPPLGFNLLSPENESRYSYRDIIQFGWEESVDPDSNAVVYYLLHLESRDCFERERLLETWSFHTGISTSLSLPDSMYDFRWHDSGDLVFPYCWWVEVISDSDTTVSANRLWLEIFGSGIEVRPEPEPFPFNFGVSVSPNPFNGSTTIRFSIPSASTSASASLRIYRLDGRLMDEMDLGRLEAGEHSIVWNADGLSAGVYLLALEAGGERLVRKVALLR